MVKRLSVYGDYETSKWVIRKQRSWIRRRDGVWQRYWYKTRVKVTVEESGRYEFYGRGRDLYRAVRLSQHYMPKGYVEVEARDFIENPEKYGVEGEWIWREVES